MVEVLQQKQQLILLVRIVVEVETTHYYLVRHTYVVSHSTTFLRL